MPGPPRIQIGSSRERREAWPYLLVALLAVVPFVTGLGNGFVFDDQGLVLENPAVWSDSLRIPWMSRYWPNSESAGLYRPLTTFSFWLDGRIWGQVPRAFVGTNLLLHSLVTLLLLSCLRALFPRRRGLTLVAATVFAVHPLHSEAVVGIVGRAELWAALGSLGAYRAGLLFLRSGRSPIWATLSALSLLLGLLGKESATGLVLLLGFHLLFPPEGDQGSSDASHGSRRPVLALGGLWAAAIAIALLARIRVLGDLVALGPIGRIDNVLAHVGIFDRILTALFVQARVIWQLIWPADLSPDYSYPQIVPSTAHAWIGAAFAMASTGVLVWAFLRRDREILWGWVFSFAAGILTSNLVFAIGTVYGERLAYLPSAGILWILLVLAGRFLARGAFRRTLPFGPPLRFGLILVAVTALGVRSAFRAPEWRSNVVLFEAASRTSDRSAKVWTNLGLARILEGDIAGGLTATDRAIELDPDYPAAIQAKGSALVQAGRPSEAIPWLERNRGLQGKRGLDALLELGNAQLALENGQEALRYFSEARSRSTETDERWMVGLASAYALQSNWPESRRYWQNAVSIVPENSAFRQRYAYVLWKDGELDEAGAIYRALWSEEPEDPERMNELAWFLAATGRDPEEALLLAADAYERHPDANVADTWLEAWILARGCGPAESWLAATGSRFPADIRTQMETKLSARCGSGTEIGDGAEGQETDEGGSK